MARSSLTSSKNASNSFTHQYDTEKWPILRGLAFRPLPKPDGFPPLGLPGFNGTASLSVTRHGLSCKRTACIRVRIPTGPAPAPATAPRRWRPCCGHRRHPRPHPDRPGADRQSAWHRQLRAAGSAAPSTRWRSKGRILRQCPPPASASASRPARCRPAIGPALSAALATAPRHRLRSPRAGSRHARAVHRSAQR